MQQMDCINQQARERDCKLTKRSQAERLAIADSLIASVWEEYVNGSIDTGTLQVAAYIQANANRIVWKLNELNNPNTPNTLKALDCICRQDAIDALLELIEARRSWVSIEDAQKEIKGIDASMCAIHDLPSVQPEIEDRMSETEQNVPNEDFISRKGAIEALMAEFKRVPTTAIRAKECLTDLPSAQLSCNNLQQLATDCISRKDAIDALWGEREKLDSYMDECLKKGLFALRSGTKAERNRIEEDIEIITRLPSAQPPTDSWCHDCKEYDHENHYCPRWNRVIRKALEDAQPEWDELLVICDVCGHAIRVKRH